MDYQDPFGEFSLSDFKKWMNQNKDVKAEQSFLGQRVETKLSSKRLASKAHVESGELQDVVEDFKNEGGIVIEARGSRMLVEVDSGSFLIHKNHLQIIED